MREQNTIEIDVKVVQITSKAYLVETDIESPESALPKTVEEWIPKSQVMATDCLAVGDEGTMEITEWIAKQKGWMEDDE
jgi:hypothetical protein